MCKKHEPVKVYDSGGTQTICGKCGAPLGDWKQNSGNGKHPKKDKKIQPTQAVH